MDDLIFLPLKIICPDCRTHLATSIEELHFKDEITCPKCSFKFIPDIDVEELLKLMKLAEEALSKRQQVKSDN